MPNTRAVRKRFPERSCAPSTTSAVKAWPITTPTPRTKAAADSTRSTENTSTSSAKEGVDTSYTKGFADYWEGEAVKPPHDMLYVGWTAAGEWLNYTIDVAEDGVYSIDILYTSRRGGELSLDVNGQPIEKPIIIADTSDPKDTTAWRQWHHWNLSKSAAQVKLAKGRNLLTLHVVKQGNMNLGTMEFRVDK